MNIYLITNGAGAVIVENNEPIVYLSKENAETAIAGFIAELGDRGYKLQTCYIANAE